MAGIEQELTITDNFSRTLEQFGEKINKAYENLQKFEKQAKKNTDFNKQLSDGLEKFNKAANQLAENGISRLTKSLFGMAAAYTGLQKISQAAKNSIQMSDDATRIGNRYGVYDAHKVGNDRGAIRELTNEIQKAMFGVATKYNMDMNSTAQVMSSFSRVTTNLGQLDKLLNLASRFTAIKPGSSTAENANILADMFQSRNFEGLSSVYGVDLRRIKEMRLNWQAQNGRWDTVMSMVEELAQSAGATQPALDRMKDSPGKKIESLTNLFNNSLIMGTQIFVKALEPALDYLVKIGRQGAFIQALGNIFTFAANSVTIFVKNFDRLINILGIAMAIWAGLKMAIIAATIAQGIFNAVALMNPITLIAAAVGVLTGGLLILTYRINKSRNEFGSLYNIVLTVAQAFNVLYNIVGIALNPFITVFDKLKIGLSGLADFVKNIFVSPLAALVSLFQTAFNVIGQIVLQVADLVEKVSFGSIKGITLAIEKSLNSGNDNIDNLKVSLGGKVTEGQRATDNYLKGFDFTKLLNNLKPHLGIGADENKLESILKESLGVQTESRDLFRSINYKWDPDEWLDAFKEYTHSAMERRSILEMGNRNGMINNNVTINNRIDGSKMSPGKVTQAIVDSGMVVMSKLGAVNGS